MSSAINHDLKILGRTAPFAEISKLEFASGIQDDGVPGRTLLEMEPIPSYTQKLWMRVKRKAAYLPG